MTTENSTGPDHVRQGDILLIKCDAPESDRWSKVKMSDSDVVARGEATNHHHRVQNATIYQRGGREMFLQTHEDAQMSHEEHGTVTLESNTWYKVVRQREHTPQSVRYVRD